MDRSIVEQIVDNHIGALKKVLGVEGWTLYTNYRETSVGKSASAEIERDVFYSSAEIIFDPSCYEDTPGEPDRVIQNLRHELLHLICAPFDLLLHTIRDSMPDAEFAKFHAARRYATEQTVLNLERLCDNAGVYKRGTVRPFEKPSKVPVSRKNDSKTAKSQQETTKKAKIKVI